MITLNQLLQFFTRSHKALTQISSKDKILLKKFVNSYRPNSKCYEDSWGYIIQATRYGGFKWYDPENNALVFFCRKSESDSTLVVPNYFAQPNYLKNIISKVQQKLNISKTILKNVNVEDVDMLLSYGFRPYHKDEYWSKDAHYDDQTYPQLIMDLKQIFEAKGSQYRPLRKVLNKNLELSIRSYKSDDLEEVLGIFALNDGLLPNRLKGMFFSSHAMYPSADVDKYVITENLTKKIVGFTATSRISYSTFALVASLFDPSIKNISTWGEYETLVLKYNEGYKKASFGGCEFQSTYHFKQEKFCPTEKIYKTHLVLENKTN